MVQEPIKVGLIGYGMGGRVFHAPVIESVPALWLHRVVETKPENICHVQEKYPDVKVVSTADEIFSDSEIELVVVATPNTSHYDLAKRGLKHGKHVVVEKPFTITTDEADQLIALANSVNKVLTVHHNRRWDSDFRTVQRILKEGRLGDIVDYEAHYDRYRPGQKGNWREKQAPGSGILYDLGSHLIDQALVLFGLPREISALLSIDRPNGEAVDYFNIIMQYPRHRVTLKAGMLVKEAGPRFTLHGTQGSFLKYGCDPQEEALKNGLIPAKAMDWGMEPEEIWGLIYTESNGRDAVEKIESEPGDYREFYRNVAKAIRGYDELSVKPYEARNTIRTIELAEQSHKEKRWIAF